MHQNINGLIGKSDVLSVHLNELSCQGKPVDVICITEHNMKDVDKEHVYIANYRLVTYSSRNNRNGGTCILIKFGHEFKIIDIKKYCIQNIIECCAIELVAHKLIIICIYRPPKSSKDAISIFFEKIELIFHFCCRELGRKVLLCGDFNIDILKSTKLSQEFQNLLLNFSLIPSIKQPTRISSQTCIDNIIHNIRGGRGEVLELALSDHTAQLFCCPVKKTCLIDHWCVLRRDYNNENKSKFVDVLNRLSFNEIYHSTDPEVAFNEFHNLFKLFYDLCFPIVKRKISTRKSVTWISKGIRNCSRRKRQMLWRYRRLPNIESKLLFKQYSKRLKNVIRLTQKCQNSYMINNSENKTKATWNLINRSKTIFPPEPLNKIIIDNKHIRDPEQIATAFNDYFIDLVQPTIANNNTSTPSGALSGLSYYPKTLFMSPTDPLEIYKVINSLRNTPSVGHDGITTKIVKLVAHIIAPVLSFIINLCIEYGHFPNILKMTIIKPLYKKGDKTFVSNYRPIALIPIFSKIIEKIIYRSLNSFFETNDLLAKEQYGFRKNKNINKAIFELFSEIVSNVDKKNPISVLLMDMSKAFDHVNYDILIGKLERYGIRGNILDLLKSYLTNRKQITVFNRICTKSKKEITYMSSARDCISGVPQGSVLGPLLFLIYINDLPKCTEYQTVLFADDSTLIVPCKNIETYQNDINTSLNNIIEWLLINKLKINIDKTNIMSFNQRTEKPNLNITYADNIISEINNARFLGIHLDSQLNWKFHIDIVTKKLNNYSYELYNLSKIVNEAVVLVAYKAYVSSTLRFGIIFWGNSTDKDNAFKAQKKCIRAMFRLKPRDSCIPIFKKFSLLTLPCIYIFETALFIKTNANLFKNLKSKRRHNEICTESHNTALYTKNFLGMAPRIYNKMPRTIRELDKISDFKKTFLKLLHNKTYYSVDEYLTDKSLF